MQDLKLIFLSFAAVLTLSSLANAQILDLQPIPVGLQGQPREELAARRSQLEAQWYTLLLKVNDHNRKCNKVPVNTPLANECRENMKSLQGEIAAHMESAKSYNEAVQRHTTIDRIEVPLPKISPEEACDGNIACLLNARVEKAMSWLPDKSWDARVWANDPMHAQWIADAGKIALPFMVQAGLSKIRSLMPASNAPRHIFLTETEFWNIDPNVKNVIYHIKFFSDGSVRELGWLVNYKSP